MVFIAVFLAWTFKLALFYQRDRPSHWIHQERSIGQADEVPANRGSNTRLITETGYSDQPEDETDDAGSSPQGQNVFAPNSIEEGNGDGGFRGPSTGTLQISGLRG